MPKPTHHTLELEDCMAYVAALWPEHRRQGRWLEPTPSPTAPKRFFSDTTTLRSMGYFTQAWLTYIEGL
jgi:hypothetical protein